MQPFAQVFFCKSMNLMDGSLCYLWAEPSKLFTPSFSLTSRNYQFDSHKKLDCRAQLSKMISLLASLKQDNLPSHHY